MYVFNILPVSICLLLVSLPASADVLRCGNAMVAKGDSKASVLLKCGEPLLKDSFCQPVPQIVASVPVNGMQNQRPELNTDRSSLVVMGCEPIEEWTYNPGPGSFLTTLHFQKNRIVALTLGEKLDR